MQATPHYICENCGTLFTGRARKYCSRKCRDAAYYKRKKVEEFAQVKFNRAKQDAANQIIKENNL